MKQWLLRIGLGLLGVVGLLYVFLLIRSFLPATVPDQELRLPHGDILETSNAFTVLQKATNQIWWPDDQSKKIYQLASDTNWDDALAEIVLTNNQAALAAWDAAATLPDFQAPELKQFGDVESGLPYLASWKKFSQLAAVRENDLLHHGRNQEGFDQIMNHIKVGRRIQHSQVVLIGYLVGAAVNNMGLSQMRHWAGTAHLDPGQLKQYIQELEPQPGEESAAYATTIKAEFRCQAEMLNAMHDGQLASGSYMPRISRWWPIFNLSQSKALFAQGALGLIQAASHHYIEGNAAVRLARPGLLSIYLSGNAIGQILFYQSEPALVESLATKSRCDVQCQSTRTILALRAYQLNHGNLPPDLSALVPEFLEAVPVDDFDGQPLRYSREKKIVYSVDKNLKDDGGDDRGPEESNANLRHLELALHFNF